MEKELNLPNSHSKTSISIYQNMIEMKNKLKRKVIKKFNIEEFTDIKFKFFFNGIYICLHKG